MAFKKESKMEESLKITPEAVRRAAKKCSQAKAILYELFPEAFEVGVNYKENKLGEVLKACRDYSGFASMDCPQEGWLPRERYMMARIFGSGIRATTLEEIKELGIEQFSQKYIYHKD